MTNNKDVAKELKRMFEEAKARGAWETGRTEKPGSEADKNKMVKARRVEEIIEYMSPCPMCKHYNPEDPMRCIAFSEGIPKDVFYGKTPHLRHMDGDHGYKYEPISDEINYIKMLNIKLQD